MDFAVSADHRVKLKESEKKENYPDLARELKKMWNMQVTFIPIIIGAFGTVTVTSTIEAIRGWRLRDPFPLYLGT